MATTGSISDSFYHSAWGVVTNQTVTLTWTRSSYSSTSNYSTIGWSLSLTNNNNSNAGAATLNGNYSVTIEGRTYTGTGSGVSVSYGGGTGTIASGTKTVYHDEDGTKSFTYSFSYTNGTSLSMSASGTAYPDRIYRPATITSAPNFNDTANPTIKYSNPSGTAMSSVQVGISLSSGATPVIAYRNVTLAGTSYTFYLTDAERTVLRKAITTGNSRTVYFRIKSSGGGSTYYRELAKTVTLIDYTPLLTPNIYDTNAVTTKLTADSSVLVRYYSNAYISSGAKARKEATISSVKCTNDEQYITTSTGYMDNLHSNTFKFSCTDSRGFTTTQDYTVDWIPYVKLTSSLTTGLLSSNGTLTFTIKGKYFNGNFGAYDNTMEVEYALRQDGGDIAWTRIGYVTPTMTGDEDYSYSYTITGLDYLSQYELTVNVIDELSPVQQSTTVVAATPVFDWSFTDFHHHTDVKISEGNQLTIGNTNFTGVQNILWSGASHMNGSQSISLSSYISEQTNGIVLVFSLYTNGVANDTSISSFFISKKQIELLGGAPHFFFLGINSGFSVIGAKYLYISDDIISGHATNTSSSSNNGITFNNSRFVLRYVIGV